MLERLQREGQWGDGYDRISLYTHTSFSKNENKIENNNFEGCCCTASRHTARSSLDEVTQRAVQSSRDKRLRLCREPKSETRDSLNAFADQTGIPLMWRAVAVKISP